MQFSRNWLKDFIDLNLSTEDICSQLTMAGIEVDGYDVIFLASSTEIENTFHSLKENIIFSAEHNFSYKLSWKFYYYFCYPKLKTKNRFINAGSFVGKVSSIKKLFEDINISHNDPCDQSLFHQK